MCKKKQQGEHSDPGVEALADVHRDKLKCKPAVYKPQFTGLEVMKISDPVCFVCWYGSDLHGCDGPSSNVEFLLSIHCEVSLDYNFQVTKTDTTLKVILTELLLTF